MTNKTTPTDADVMSFLRSIPDEARRSDAKALCELMAKATGVQPKMWGSSIIGFGSHHYVYESGREGDIAAVGFSPRRDKLVLYSVADGVDDDKIHRLGKIKCGKDCIHVKSLVDVDEKVLASMVKSAFRRRNSV